MPKNFNIEPYFDDYSADKGYHRVLFRPSVPVQARELTQLQTILQEQIKRNADHTFKNGTMVIPGNLFYDNRIYYIKLELLHSGYYADSVIETVKDKILTGQTSGVEAKAILVSKSENNDPPTLFVKYIAGNGANSQFSQNEELVSENGVIFKIQNITNYTGYGTICSIDEGIYYINGFFVKVLPQKVVLSKYTDNVTTTVGLKLNETIITEQDDESLYDNALGFSNYSAPGAHRYKIELQLVAEDDTSEFTNENFIQILSVKEGEVQRLINYTKYSEIEKLLARRTYDESGDYIIDNFNVVPYEYRDNDRGQWLTSTVYLKGDVVWNTVSGKTIYYYAKSNGISGVTAPTHTFGSATDGTIFWQQTNSPYYNYGLNKPKTTETLQDNLANADRFIYSVSQGKAYIKGFEVITDNVNITANKARTYNQVTDAQMYAPTGTYVGVYDVVGTPNIATYEVATIKDVLGNTVGTAYARNLEFDTLSSGQPEIATTAYKLFLVGIKMNTGKDFSLHAYSINISTTFTCKIFHKLVMMLGTVSVTTGSAIVTGKGTDFDRELAVGSTVVINGETKVILSINGDYQMTMSSNYGGNATDVGYELVKSELVSLADYVVPMPHSYIKTIRDENGALNTSYIITKKLTFTSSGTSHVYTLSATGETFNGTTGHILVRDSDGAHISAGYSLNINATQLTITGITATSFTLLAQVKRVGVSAKEKVKVLSSKTIIATASDIRDSTRTTVLSSASNYKQPRILLTEADVLRINKVTISGADGNYDSTGEIDITDWFTCDTGIKPEVYSIGEAILKPGKPTPTREIKVTFEYFDHSDGDYFSIDSYQGIPYEYVPTHSNGISLSDCLDFRSRMSDDGLGFSGAGSQISEPLVSTSVMGMDYSYYLPRLDRITLDNTGQFELFEGTPSLRPEYPSVPAGTLPLIKASVDAYTTIAPRNVLVKVEEHRRYTMKDINSIDKRLSNVEQIVALTALENDTNNMKVVDMYGLDRYKNGFLVDQFKNHEVGDFYNPEYNCSIDTTNKELRPSFFMTNTPLIEPEGTTTAVRTSKKYTVGQGASLPYTHVPVISQGVASRETTINPFNDVNFFGVITLSPSEDVWFDSVALPDKVTVVEGNFEAEKKKAGTVYSAWSITSTPPPTPTPPPIPKKVPAGEGVYSSDIWNPGSGA